VDRGHLEGRNLEGEEGGGAEPGSGLGSALGTLAQEEADLSGGFQGSPGQGSRGSQQQGGAEGVQREGAQGGAEGCREREDKELQRGSGK